jgi:TRAP transporter 4TM/12TM fusion protein
MSNTEIDRIESLTEEYDPELRFRPVTGAVGVFAAAWLAALSLFHYFTAALGPLEHRLHTGIHLAFVLSLIFLVFPVHRSMRRERLTSRWPMMGGVPLYDWFLFGLTIVVAMYPAIVLGGLSGIFGNEDHPVGIASMIEVGMGTLMIGIVLETTRRAMGKSLPIICLVFILYALFGDQMPSPLTHNGHNWSSLVTYLYFSTDGIYGLSVLVIASYVFHFVLFGVFAMRIGLGELFLDIAYCIAGRFAGGPAKISVLSSAFVGMISGSSIANTISTGAYTIPAMKRIGYAPHFAAAVAAAASTGGQITPPIMGAAAFLMIEFLGLPCRDIIIAALVPAFMPAFKDVFRKD